MKRMLLTGVALSTLLLGTACADRNTRADRRSVGVEAEEQIEQESRQMQRDIDEEFKDPNEPGDAYGGETKTMGGEPEGSPGTGLDEMGEDLKRDIDEEFRDVGEPADDYGTETQSLPDDMADEAEDMLEEGGEVIEEGVEELDEEF